MRDLLCRLKADAEKETKIPVDEGVRQRYWLMKV